MTAQILRNLRNSSTFARPIYSNGIINSESLLQHVSRLHVHHNGDMIPRPGEAKFGKSLFIIRPGETEFNIAQLVVLGAKSSSDSSELKVECQRENEYLTLKIKIPTKIEFYDYTFNGVIKKPMSDNIVVVVRKMWLGDHFSKNLTPSSFYPAKINDKSEVRVLVRNIRPEDSTKHATLEEIEHFQHREDMEAKSYNQEKSVAKVLENEDLEIQDISDEEDIDQTENYPMDDPTQAIFSQIKNAAEQSIIEINYPEELGGGKYMGSFKNGLKHGRGYEEKQDGCYRGQFENGSRCGRGNLVLKNGDSYSGDFRNDLYHGKGKMTYAASNEECISYEGKWKNGKMHKGVMTYKDKSIYEGPWQDGRAHSQGKMKPINGKIYDSARKNDQVQKLVKSNVLPVNVQQLQPQQIQIQQQAAIEAVQQLQPQQIQIQQAAIKAMEQLQPQQIQIQIQIQQAAIKAMEQRQADFQEQAAAREIAHQKCEQFNKEWQEMKNNLYKIIEQQRISYLKDYLQDIEQCELRTNPREMLFLTTTPSE